MTTTKNKKMKGVLKEMQPFLEGVGGFILGNVAINMANKALKIDPNDSNTKLLKKAAPPLAIATGALIGKMKVKNKLVQNLLSGAATAGGVKTIKAALPNSSFLGDLGMTPVSAVSNADRWVYLDNKPVAGLNLPELGNIQSPENGSGYYIDAPAYFQGTDNSDDLAGSSEDFEML